MIDWQSVVVRLNKLFIGNLRLVSHVALAERIPFTSSVPSIPRTGLRFDTHNKERSCPLFKGYCRPLAKSAGLSFSGKERCLPAASFKNSNLDGHKRKGDGSGNIRAEREQNDLN